ncbi:hypothetical protein FNH08_22725 [Streptomyces spongiae]|uniref:Uncharacterized protein n=1 Tax=Streptomyces spongiae TaxID=565072 RepID=A0A5N8XLE3_9ACTN|nr:hypothetical protein [Streptomyces spongiae]
MRFAAVVRGRIVPLGQRARVLPARFGRCAAPRASQGAIEVPLARVAVVHDAGRLSSTPVTFPGEGVKVVHESHVPAHGGEDSPDHSPPTPPPPPSPPTHQNRYAFDRSTH